MGEGELSKDVQAMLKIIDTLQDEEKAQFLSKLASVREGLNLDQLVDNDLEK